MMTPRQKHIADIEVATAHVRQRARDPESAPQWRDHLRRNERKIRWLRFLETKAGSPIEQLRPSLPTTFHKGQTHA